MAARFNLGQTVITSNALANLAEPDVLKALQRHVQGDWGDICTEDWEENELALKSRLRLLSVYSDRNEVKFWIITEADRSATTVLLPEDY